MRRLALAALFLAAACSRPSPEPAGSVEYSPPDGSFTARLPGGWKADDAPGKTRKAAFFGPPDGRKPFSELIAVRFFPAGGRYKDPRAYAAAQAAFGKPAPPPREIEVGATRGLELRTESVFSDVHSGPQALVTRSVLLPAGGGFYALEHTYPAAGPSSAAIFEDVLRSFRPRPAAN